MGDTIDASGLPLGNAAEQHERSAVARARRGGWLGRAVSRATDPWKRRPFSRRPGHQMLACSRTATIPNTVPVPIATTQVHYERANGEYRSASGDSAHLGRHGFCLRRRFWRCGWRRLAVIEQGWEQWRCRWGCISGDTSVRRLRSEKLPQRYRMPRMPPHLMLRGSNSMPSRR